MGMVWFRKPDACSGINRCGDLEDRPHDIRYARPSSYHPGGVIAAFCDGHTQFISDEIDYIVYQHLMTPDDKGAELPRATINLDASPPTLQIDKPVGAP